MYIHTHITYIYIYVCVCNIWIDVKLPSSFFFPLLPFYIMQGDTAFDWDCVQRSYQWNGISSLASWTYLHFFVAIFDCHGTRPSLEPHSCIFTSRLSQSGITVDPLRLVQLHQNLPQSKDVESTFVLFCLHDRRQHRRRWYSLPKFRRRYSSPMVLLLVYSFFLMSILNQMTILMYFYYS